LSTSIATALLDAELRLCRRDERLHRAGARVWRRATDVFVAFAAGRDGQPGLFCLRCANYDAQPPSVAMLDPVSLAVLPIGSWTAGVPHSIHPVTQQPFVCLQGIAEYHSHPSHLDDSWDRYRNRVRIRETVFALLKKAGALT